MADNDIRIQRIIDLIANINEGQIAIEPSADSDLDFTMFGYQNESGTSFKLLAKDQLGRLAALDLIEDSVTPDVGRLWYDSDSKGLVFGMSSSVNLNIGEEHLIRVRNITGAQIDDGTVVYISGASGDNPTIAEADKDSANAELTIGIATEDIADNGFGYVTTQGIVRDLDLSSYSVGDELWLGDDGGYSVTQPNAPAISVKLGHVVSDHAINGMLLTDVRVCPKLQSLSDVDRTLSPADGEGLAWVDANSRFEYTEFLTDAVTSLEADGEAGGPITGDLKFYAGANFYIAQAVDGFILNAIADETVVVPDSLTLNTGTLVSGDVTDVQTPHDGNFYIVDEVSGVPGFDFIFDFISVEQIDRFRYYYDYQGIVSHICRVKLYNWTTTTWITVGSFTGTTVSGDQKYIDLHVDDGSDYIDGSGNARMQIYHETTGNPSHQISSEYAALVSYGVGGGGQATLADGAVGYGDSSNLLTGDATYFRWDATNRIFKIGALEPDDLTGFDCLHVTGRSEFRSDVYFRDDVRCYEDKGVYFGNTNLTAIFYSAYQTNPCIHLFMGQETNRFLISNRTNRFTDVGLPTKTNPTLTIVSADIASDTTQYASLEHDQVNMLLTAGAGSVAFSDEYVSASTWTDSFIPLFNSTAEWSAAYTLLGSATGSVWALINAAASAGGGASTLQEAYEGGNTILSTDADGTVSIASSATATVAVLTLASGNATTGGDIIAMDNDDTSSNAITFTGSAGAGKEVDGHKLEADGSLAIIGDFTTNGQALFRAWISGEGTDNPQAIVEANDGASASAFLKVEAIGDATLESTDDVTLRAGDKIYLDATDDVSFSDSPIVAMKNTAYGTLTVNTLTAGVASINWLTDTDIQRVTLNANCTEVEMTGPDGPGSKILIFECDGTSRTITNFTNGTTQVVTWFGNYDPDTTAYAVPANENVIVRLVNVTTNVYLGWLIGEV